MFFDFVIAVRTDNGVVGEGPKPRRFVFFLQIHQFAGVAPALFVFRVVAVLDESQGSATVFDQVSTNGSNP
jgi:hypothetical protein